MDHDDLVNAFLTYFNSMLESPVEDDENTEDIDEAILSFATNITAIIADYVNSQDIVIVSGDHTEYIGVTEMDRIQGTDYAYSNLLTDSSGANNNVDAGIADKIDTYLWTLVDKIVYYDRASVKNITSAAIGELAALKNLPTGSPDAEQPAINQKSAELLANIVEEYYNQWHK